MAFKSIMHNKMRSFLTMLGIIIGVFAVITLVSTIQGVQRQTMEAYSNMGKNIISAYYGNMYGSSGGKDVNEEFFEECASLSDYILGVTSSRSFLSLIHSWWRCCNRRNRGICPGCP